MNENQQYCLDLVRRDDHERFLISLFLPKSAQRAVWALLAFNQEVAKIRENTTETKLGEIRLQWWLEVIDEIQSSSVREQPVIMEMASLEFSEKIWALLKEILEARRLEMSSGRPGDLLALEQYALGTGGALHEAMALVCGDNSINIDASRAARAAGASWAMMGLIRALPFHWQTNHSLLPAENDAAMQQRDAGKAFTALKPAILRMKGFVEEQVLEASDLYRKLVPAERISLSSLVLTNLHLRSLSKADGNPFNMPTAEFSDLYKIMRLFWFRLSGRI